MTNFIPRKGKHIWPIIIIAIIILFFALFYTTHKKSIRQEVVFVSAALVTKANTVIYADAVGNVLPHATVSLKSLVDGEIIKVNFKEGDFVKAGQVLFEIDPRSFQVKLAEAKANLAKDEAQLASAETLLERNSKLVDKGYVSKQDFDQVKADHDSLVATVDSDKAAVSDAELQLSYCTIKSPFDGKTGTFLLDKGSLVKANDTNALVVINQIMPIDVKFSLTEKQLPQIQEQLQHGSVTVKAYLQQDVNVIKEGTLSFIDNTVDTQSGMIQLKASFPNQDNYLWPGQFVTVKIPIENLQNAILIPTRAIQVGENKTFVYVIKNHITKMTPVVLGDNVGDQTVIRQGLQTNDLVVTEGQLRLSDGSKVDYK